MDVGNYTLSDLLGRGGTSEVYAAQHRFLGDSVAVKLLRASLGDDERARDAFVAEAARTREIQHPNVVRVLDFGHDPATGSCYLVMERIEGESLAARLRRVGRLDETALRELAAHIAEGMQAAHERGIVHRDLKPGNVMLRGDTPTIIDFGIAKSLGDTTAAVTERRIGTVAYMAPEQLVDGLITPAVDIWALGVILYEAATGQAPFASFSDGRLPQLFESPRRASSLAPISPALDDLIARCLDRDPGKRPASMGDVARWLREGDGERVTEDIGAPAIVRPAPNAPRRRWWPLAAGAVLIAAVGAATIVLVTDDDPQRETVPAEPPIVLPASPPPSAPSPVPEPTPAVTPAPTPASEARVERKRTKPRVKKTKTTRQGETLD
ncbi:MAG TPA: serine/threonine-protein kinase [Kofleriaceae bacterium]